MRVHVVSDVHGNVEGLLRAGEGADTLLILGDLLDMIDYHDPSAGVLGTLFGAERVGLFIRMRAEPDRSGAYRYLRSLWGTLADPAGTLAEVVTGRYTDLLTRLAVPTIVTPGNIDDPRVLATFARDGLTVVDGRVVEVGGLRFGFLGGVPTVGAPFAGTGPWASYLRDPGEFTTALSALGDMEVLCTHAPPAVAELTYDVVARRNEPGSTGMIDVIRRVRPKWSLFGHIHQPLSRRVRLYHTECANVGHFQRRGVPFVLRW